MISAFLLSAVFLVSYVVSKLPGNPAIYGDFDLKILNEEIEIGKMRFYIFCIINTHRFISSCITSCNVSNLQRNDRRVSKTY